MRIRVLAVLMVALGLVAIGQEIPPRESFEVSDLQLVSYAALPDGTEAYTGPVCTAIVLAWFGDHGFRALLPDLTGDGVIDEQDTVELARRLSSAMRVRPDRGALDPWLVDTLARYVAERYPGEFTLKIYDDSFEQEYRAVMGKPFDPANYPGIKLEVKHNPTHGDYSEELLSAEGVILGIGREREVNRFFVGRSFKFDKQPEGWPVDVVDTSDDPAQPGPQGQVFPTYMREGTTHWLFAYAGWQAMEIMLALSPVREPEPGETKHPCAPDAFGYDVTTVETDFGSFQVEECAVHDGDRDLYYYTVTNIDFLYNDCGICEFYIPNTGGLTTLAQWGPAGWLVNVWDPAGWSWTAPATSCGILPGESAVFGFAVPAPTTDVARPAAIATCILGGPVTHLDVRHIKFTTTGPEAEEEEEGCPDLIVTNVTSCWTYNDQKQMVVEVKAWVKNIGTETAYHIRVCIKAGSASAMVLAGTVAPGSTKSVSATLVLSPNMSFPIPVTVVADCTDKAEECDETNNTAYDQVDRGDTCQ